MPEASTLRAPLPNHWLVRHFDKTTHEPQLTKSHLQSTPSPHLQVAQTRGNRPNWTHLLSSHDFPQPDRHHSPKMMRTPATSLLRAGSRAASSRLTMVPRAAASTQAISNPTLANIEKRWEGMPSTEQAELWMALRDRMKENWADLTVQEKKAGRSHFDTLNFGRGGKTNTRPI
jgi:hypothetical protein